MTELQRFIASRTPTGWETRPLWSLFRRKKRTGYPDEELLSVYRDYGVIPKSSRDDNHNKESDDLSGYQLVTEGSLVTNKMKAWQGSIAISRYRGIVSPAYYVYEPLSDEWDQFLHYLLRSEPYIALYGRISKGVRVNQWDLEHEALRNVPVMLPDLPTQKAIADFLDRETVRIDQLIEKKQRLVTLQTNRLLSLLQGLVLGGATVRRGLNGDWLHDLPSGWMLTPLKNLVTVMGGATPSKEREDFWIGDIPWVSPKDMKSDVITDATDHLSEAGLTASAAQLVPAQSVLIVVRGMILSRTVPICRLGVSATINQDMKALIPRRKSITSEYLQRMLQGFEDVLMSFIEEAAHGTKKLRSEALFGLKFPIPPLGDQEKICSQYEQARERSDRLSAATVASIDRLREFRAALITTAVTGQIDVATWGRRGEPDRRLDAIQREMAS